MKFGNGTDPDKDPLLRVSLKEASLDFYIQLAREAGHPQTGGLAQAQVIQNIVTGRAAQAIIVISACRCSPYFERYDAR